MTHSLVGYALGRCLAARAGRPAEPAVRAAALCGVLASNAPDLDFVVGPLAHDPKLTYLLHHRGHTHTLLLAIPIGLLIALACMRLYRVREASERRVVLAAGLLGALLHIGFDALNEYGVHPFFPFDNSWYYGDAVFIIEPLLLAALLPLPLLSAFTFFGRALAALACVALFALVLGVPGVPPPTVVATSVMFVLALVAQHRLRARAELPLVAATLLVAVFALASSLAQGEVRAQLVARFPDERIHDIVTSPVPANPLCHSVLAVTLDGADVYRVRLGSVSLLPSQLPPGQCAFRADSERTATLRTERWQQRGVRFESLYETPAAHLRTLARAHCRAASALQFMRVPFASAKGIGTAILGDLRYDREPDLGFAEVVVEGACRDWPAPWIPPRADLLR